MKTIKPGEIREAKIDFCQRVKDLTLIKSEVRIHYQAEVNNPSREQARLIFYKAVKELRKKYPWIVDIRVAGVTDYRRGIDFKVFLRPRSATSGNNLIKVPFWVTATPSGMKAFKAKYQRVADRMPILVLSERLSTNKARLLILHLLEEYRERGDNLRWLFPNKGQMRVKLVKRIAVNPDRLVKGYRRRTVEKLNLREMSSLYVKMKI